MTYRFISTYGILFALSVMLLLAMPARSAAQTLGSIGASYDWETLLFVAFSIDLILVLLAAFVIALTMLRLGFSNLGIVWGHFLLAVCVLASAHAFVLLAGAGYIGVAGGDTDVWWELMYILGVLHFFTGLHALQYMESRPGETLSAIGFFGWVLFSIVYVSAIYVTPELLSRDLVEIFSGSMIYQLGLFHWIGVIVNIFILFFALRLRSLLGQVLRSFISTLVIMSAVLTFFHFWELFVDYYSIVNLSERIYAFTAESIMLAVAVLLLVAFYQARRDLFILVTRP